MGAVRVSGLLLIGAVLLGHTAGVAQFVQNRMPDPKKCRVVIEDFGNVGYRISDAQQLAQIALTHLRKRMGQDAVVYEGMALSAKKMKKMLGPQSETEIQDEQIAYYKAAIDQAKFRVRLRFGKAKKQHWVRMTCRNARSPKATTLSKKTIRAKTFREALRQVDEAMPTFCLLMDPPKPAVVEPKRGPPKPWAAPPRR